MRRPSSTSLIGLLGRAKRGSRAAEQIFVAGGLAGPTGPAGAAGRDAGLKYAYSNNTANSDPGSGTFKFDSTTFASITKLRISETDGDTNTIFAALATWDDGTSTIKGRLHVRKQGSATPLALFDVTGTLTDNGTWDQFDVTPVTGALPANGDDCRLVFVPKGDKGDAGAAGSNGSAGGDGSVRQVRVVTAAALPAYTRTTNVLLANANGALPAIDGVSVAVNDVVLLKDGAAGADNGAYTVDALGSAGAKWQMTRVSWMDASAEAVPGMEFQVSEGDLHKDSVWMLTTNATITLNTTALAFRKISGTDYICIQDQKAANTHGGGFTSGAYRTRDLNTEQADTGNHASVASNQITLAAGTYRCRGHAPALGVDQHKARLRNVTDGSTLLAGTSEFASSNASVPGSTRSFFEGRFTLTASKTLEVQHQCTTTRATDGLGTRSNFTEVEVYTTVEFWRE